MFTKRSETLPQTINKELLQKEMDQSEVLYTLSLFFYKAIQKNEKSKPRRNVGGTTTALCTAPSIFNSHDVLHITPPTPDEIRDFINNIFQKRRLAAETGVVAFVLLMRTSIKMNSLNWMRLILISLLLANKEAEDVYNVWNVRFVGLIPNLPLYEINLLEMEFLQFLKYRLHVERPTYQKYYQNLVALLPEIPDNFRKQEDSEPVIESDSDPSPRRSDNEDMNPVDIVDEIRPSNFDRFESFEEGFGSVPKIWPFSKPVSGTCSSAVHQAALRPSRLSEKISRVESIP